MALTLQWVEKATTKAERADALRCVMQQCAMEMHNIARAMDQDDWSEYESRAGSPEFAGLGEDIAKLLEDGEF
jgi:hypothetical protein